MADSRAAVPPFLDHIVVATPNLEALVAEFEKATGVAPVRGGSHEKLGTTNYLVSFGGDHYLELLGIDHNLAEPDAPRPFNIDDLSETVVSTWVIHPEDADATVENGRAAGVDVGDLAPASRRKPDGELLSWRLTPPLHGGRNGAIPFLIDWQGSTSPAHSTDARAVLESFVIHTDDPDSLGVSLDALGTRVDMCCRGTECPSGKCQGELPCLELAVSGPAGTWTI